MSNVKWIKLSTSMFDDEKIKLIEQMPDADTILVIWVKLLAQAGKTNSSGYIFLNENIPYTDEMLSTIFNRPLSTIRLALKTFEDLGMIGIDDNSFISISNWSKHQSVDKLDRMREQNRLRQQRYREKKALKSPSNNSDVTVTSRNDTEIEEELEEDIDKERDEDNKPSHELELFNHYLSKDIIQHQKMTSHMRGKAKTTLKEYSLEDLKEVIDNYSDIYKGDEYYFKTKYTFVDILRPKDITQFSTESEPFEKFKSFKSKTSKPIGYDPNKDAF